MGARHRGAPASALARCASPRACALARVAGAPAGVDREQASPATPGSLCVAARGGLLTARASARRRRLGAPARGLRRLRRRRGGGAGGGAAGSLGGLQHGRGRRAARVLAVKVVGLARRARLPLRRLRRQSNEASPAAHAHQAPASRRAGGGGAPRQRLTTRIERRANLAYAAVRAGELQAPSQTQYRAMQKNLTLRPRGNAHGRPDDQTAWQRGQCCHLQLEQNLCPGAHI